MSEDSMPPEVREVYNQLWQEVSHLHFRWRVFCQLFGTNPERIDLLNRFAPTFFWHAQESLFDSVSLEISKLTDPPQTRGQKNLTLETLADAVRGFDRTLGERLDDRLKAVRDKCANFRRYRNKRLAHHDYEHTMVKGPDKPELNRGSRLEVREALALIVGFMNAVLGAYESCETRFDLAVQELGDGETLIYHLTKYAKLLDIAEDVDSV